MIDIDLELPLSRFALRVVARLSGDSVAVLGPSGSGKTSLLEAVAGLRRLASGRVVLGGERLLDTSAGVSLPPERRRIGYVPQDSCLFPHLDAGGNVRFGMKPGSASEELFREVVSILEIDHLLERYPATLSGGERQRVALARAIATKPRLLLLDEPLAAIDTELKGKILPYLLRVRDALRIPFLYVTHNAGEARVVAREAIVLEEGSVVFAGPADEVLRSTTLADPEARFDNIFAGNLEEGDQPGGLGRLTVGETALWVPSEGSARPGARAVFSVAPEDVLVSTLPLQGVSARNVHPGTVVSRELLGVTAWIRIAAGGLEWTARLTRSAAEELGLEPGARVWLAVKTHAFRRLR